MTLRRSLILVAVAAVIAATGIGGYAWSNGVRFYAVESGSMSPAFEAGALAIDEPVTPTTQLHVGDVITFHPIPEVTTTHRIAAIEANEITTKGDANKTVDFGVLPRDSVVGRVVASLPYAGGLALVLRRPVGIIALLAVLIAAALAWQLVASLIRPRTMTTPATDPGMDAGKK